MNKHGIEIATVGIGGDIVGQITTLMASENKPDIIIIDSEKKHSLNLSEPPPFPIIPVMRAIDADTEPNNRRTRRRNEKKNRAKK